MKVGDDSVVIGVVPSNLVVGKRCTVVGATDQFGNAIYNRPMAVGYSARAGANSIAIGTFAGAGGSDSETIRLLEQLAARGDETLRGEVLELLRLLQCSEPDASAASRAWNAIQALATFDGASSLLSRIAVGLRSMLGI